MLHRGRPEHDRDGVLRAGAGYHARADVPPRHRPQRVPGAAAGTCRQAQHWVGVSIPWGAIACGEAVCSFCTGVCYDFKMIFSGGFRFAPPSALPRNSGTFLLPFLVTKKEGLTDATRYTRPCRRVGRAGAQAATQSNSKQPKIKGLPKPQKTLYNNIFRKR